METRSKGYWWSRGDFNGFIGFFTNILVNIMVMTGILLFSVRIPVNVVLGRILPGVGIAIALGNFYYAWMAHKVAKKTGRDDVTALPYGPSVGHLFVVTYLIIGPVFWRTSDPILAWQAGLAWCVLESVIEVAGAWVGKQIRNVTPRAAMLGNMAGLSLTLIAMKPVAQIWGTPFIGIVCIGIALVGFFSGKKLPFGIPAAGWMALFGIVIGWATGTMKLETLQTNLANVKFSFPVLSIREIIAGFPTVGSLLIACIPLGIGNALSTLNNVESADAAGDSFNVKESMIVDGVGSFAGALFGCPYPTSVYVGHPGYKAMGARRGYSVATGICTLIVCFLGLTPVLTSIIPIEALVGILVYVGLIMGSQAFQASPKQHAPAIFVAMIPWLAGWVVTIIDNTLQVAGNTLKFVGGNQLTLPGGNQLQGNLGVWYPEMINNLKGVDIFYNGLLALSRGNVITAMTLGLITVFLIDGKLKNAVIGILSLMVLSFFGFIHAPGLGINAAQNWTIGYAMFAAIVIIVKIYNDKFVKAGDSAIKKTV